MEQMITIAIPTYNRPKQLLETLKNLQRQTNQNFRIFICDNASDYDVNTEVKNNFTGEFYNKITIHHVEEMHRITESSSMLIYGKIPYPETGMVNVDPCVDKLEKLGWKAEVSFEEGIKKVLEYL